jgi:lipoprotein signal peptidase
MAETITLRQIEKIRTYEKGHQAVHVNNTGLCFGFLNALVESPKRLTVLEPAIKLILYLNVVNINTEEMRYSGEFDMPA